LVVVAFIHHCISFFSTSIVQGSAIDLASYRMLSEPSTLYPSLLATGYVNMPIPVIQAYLIIPACNWCHSWSAEHNYIDSWARQTISTWTESNEQKLSLLIKCAALL